MKELLLGCGSRTHKQLSIHNKDFKNVVRLDNNPVHNPDIIWDLTQHPLPFKDNEFDEIHVYDVLEHLAQQGDYEFFFREFSEYWRILKPGGRFFAGVPEVSSKWMWGDPSHKRVINYQTLIFLDQKHYEQVGKTAMSDFRHIYKADFNAIYTNTIEETFYFILEARK
jgi:predicted SAM-dependent methyltransferase